jgi:hypothetical protein
MQDFLRSSFVSDADVVECAITDAHRVNLSGNVSCSDALATVMTFHERGKEFLVVPLLVSIVAAIVVVGCVSVLLFVFRTPLKIWLHSRYGLRVCGDASARADKLYDAFVGYCAHDDDLVRQLLVPQMESCCYKMCVQHRDLPRTGSVADTFPHVAQLCSRHVLVVSRQYLASEWPLMRFAMQNTKKLRPILIMLDELTSLDLAAVPEFNLLLKTSTVLRWNEAGFWNKLRFFLPDGRKRPVAGYKSDLMTAAPKKSDAYSGWHYDSAPVNNNSAASTQSTSSTASTGSPRPAMQLLSNPMSAETWRNTPASEHTYQSICEVLSSGSEQPQHIYHTLEPSGGQLQYDTLGKLDVMLPNGQFVPATLVRNPTNGRIVPLVEVDSRTMPTMPPAGNNEAVFRVNNQHPGSARMAKRHFV